MTSRKAVATTRTLFSPIFLLNSAMRAQQVMVAINSMGNSDTQKFDFILKRINVMTSKVNAASNWFDAPKTGQICHAVPVEER